VVRKRKQHYSHLALWLYPEIKLFEQDEDIGEVLHSRWKRGSKDWPIEFFVVAGATALFGISVFALLNVIDHEHVKGGPLGMLTILVCLMVVFLGVFVLVLKNVNGITRRFLRKELVRRGIPVCIKCGYDLRGQTETRCPECGAEFDEKQLNPKTKADD